MIERQITNLEELAKVLYAQRCPQALINYTINSLTDTPSERAGKN